MDATIVGATEAQRAVLRGILGSLGGTLIGRIELVPLNDGRVRVDFHARRKVVFAYSAVGVTAFTYYVRPDLAGCAKKLPIANEVDPESIAPRCPS